MDTHHKKISVVIPGYNAGKTIVEAIESVLAQDWPNVECIFVDDGSCDDTESKIAPYLDRIVYIKKQNGGFASARNVAMQAATGEFIAWLDSDDIFRPEKLSRQMLAFEQHPELGMVHTDFELFDADGVIMASGLASYYGIFNVISGVDCIYDGHESLPDGECLWFGVVFDQLLQGNFIHPPTVLFRKSIFEQVGPQSEDLVNATDYEYFCRIAKRWPIGYVDASLLRYRISPGQSSAPANYARNARFNQLALRHMMGNYDLSDAQINVLKDRLHRMQLSQARHLADTNKIEALRVFLQAMRARFPDKNEILVLVKIMTPTFLINWRRHKIEREVGSGI